MPRNDDGEFELVLGNRQLLSVFFLVIVLLGVFFAMGYIMGRSGTPAQIAEMKKPDNSPTERPIVVDVGSSTARPAAAGDPIRKEEPKPEPVTKTEPEKKREEPKPEPKVEEPPKVAEKKPEPKKPEPPPAPVSTGGAPSGSYLQVAAVKKPEADIVSGIVAKKGYRAYLVPLKEGSDVYRVLVGPASGADQKKMLDDLKAEGFKPFPRRL